MSESTPAPVWDALLDHQEQLADVHMRDLFAENPQRFEQFSLQACDLLLDYSKNRITAKTLDLLIQLAEQRELPATINKLMSGEKINHTEGRAALHTALRYRGDKAICVDGKDVMPEVRAVLEQMRGFSERVRSGEWLGYTGKPIEHIVNIGIGGSDLGPAMVANALQAYWHPRLTGHYVSNLDALHLSKVLAQVDPETTLFIIASKTFTTQETITNALSARAWFIEQTGDESAIAKHFVAVSTNEAKVREFGIDTANMFAFWDWVGGRYSLWSAIGLSLVLLLGMAQFEELLSGAAEMDAHFSTAPLDQNMPVLLALVGLWYTNFFDSASQAILPYDYALELLPSYLQQLEMESNGKYVRNSGTPVDWHTCPVIWGMAGNNGQHAFYQLLHQGTQLIPVDFIVARETQAPQSSHQHAVLANALAQARALMLGRDAEDTAMQLLSQGADEDTVMQQAPHRVFPGNQPSNTIAYQRLTPKILGSLLALYEHKVFVQSVCWDINAFDQWGVELGKQMAAVLLPEFSADAPAKAYDASTNGLINWLKS